MCLIGSRSCDRARLGTFILHIIYLPVRAAWKTPEREKENKWEEWVEIVKPARCEIPMLWLSSSSSIDFAFQ